jgi:hypothetical protein
VLPRECPRVTFYPGSKSDPADVLALMGNSSATAVVAIESAWLMRVWRTILYVYALPADGFELIDKSAGYWINRASVVPIGVQRVTECLRALAERQVEIRIVPNLWPLRDAVVKSSLHYPCIRMRNALVRT